MTTGNDFRKLLNDCIVGIHNRTETHDCRDVELTKILENILSRSAFHTRVRLWIRVAERTECCTMVDYLALKLK